MVSWDSGGGLITKSCLTLVTLWTVALQAPVFWGFPRQKYWTLLPFPSPGDFLTQGPNPRLLNCRWSPALQADALPLSHQESPYGSM